MIPLIVGFAVGLVAFSSPTQALSCLPCNDTLCANVTCDSTVVKDVCGCCPVCSKKLGEECGGPWDIFGVCDQEADLVCDRFVPSGQLEFNMEGRCVRNGTQGLCKHPQVFSECASACQNACNEPTPTFCTLQCLEDPCVCGPGFIRRSLTNRTCVPTTECDVIEPITCEYPKIRSECATACPATCGEPFPSICTRNCDQDPCVCPSGFLMRSRTDRRCIRDFDCANYSFCETDCPPIDIRASPMELRKTWNCHLRKWQCTTYKWKMEMTKWWVQSCNGGRDEVESLWEDMKNMCDPMPNIRCKNMKAMECSVDAMNCRLCECSDGQYENPDELLVLWKRNFQVYSAYLDIYQQAKANCVGGC